MTDSWCECCNAEPSVGVAAVPGIPMSIAWGQKCLEAGAIPYDLLVMNTALCGGWQYTAEWWNEVIISTLTYFDKSVAEFRQAVDAEVVRQYEEESAYFGKYDNPDDDPIDLSDFDDV